MSLLLDKVFSDFIKREKKGLNTYGTTMDRTDLNSKEWLNHAYEEAMDLVLYLKKNIEEPVTKEEIIVALQYHESKAENYRKKMREIIYK